MRLRETSSPMREASMIIIIAALAGANVLLSPEIAAAFALGWLSCAVLWAREDRRLLSVSLPALAVTAVGCRFLLPDAYYASLLQFSQGANNLPMVPAAHLILYLLTLTLIVPTLVAASWRSGRTDAPLLGSLGLLCVAMMPGALGRCDPPHALFYGLVASMLLMVRLADVSRVACGVYVLVYSVVFIGMMHLVNLVVFFGLSPKDLVVHPTRAVYSFINQQRAEFSPRDRDYLTALDKYPAIGVPFATYGQDKLAEDYLFAHRRIAPEYYVSVVGVYTKADLSRKLADTLRHEYLLVGKGWEHRWGGSDRCESYLSSLRRWFLYPVDLRWIRPDLDPIGNVLQLIAERYRAVEEVGFCTVLQRFDERHPISGGLAEE
jgi:hypothetical protein